MNIDVPTVANLRLCYLSKQFFATALFVILTFSTFIPVFAQTTSATSVLLDAVIDPDDEGDLFISSTDVPPTLANLIVQYVGRGNPLQPTGANFRIRLIRDTGTVYRIVSTPDLSEVSGVGNLKDYETFDEPPQSIYIVTADNHIELAISPHNADSNPSGFSDASGDHNLQYTKSDLPQETQDSFAVIFNANPRPIIRLYIADSGQTLEPPELTVPVLSFIDSGDSGSDGITNNPVVSIASLGNNVIWQYSIDSGESFIPGTGESFTLVEGTYPLNSIQVKQTVGSLDSATASINTQLVIDTTVPMVTALPRGGSIVSFAISDNNELLDGVEITKDEITYRLAGQLSFSDLPPFSLVSSQHPTPSDFLLCLFGSGIGFFDCQSADNNPNDDINMVTHGDEYKVKADAIRDTAGNENVETILTPIVPVAPSTPPEVTAVNIGDGRVRLSWDEPYNGGSPITGYKTASKTGNNDFGLFRPILGSNAETLAYTAIGLTNGTTYAFKILAINSVGDGAESDEASAIPVANISPTANAGDNQSITPGAEVTLDGSASSDSEDDVAGIALSYNWAQTSGTTVTLSSTNTITATFTAPDVDADTDLVFTLTVTDTAGAGSSDKVTISVLPILVFSGTIDDYTYTVGEATSLTLPIATGGRSPLTYTLESLPDGFSFDADSRILSGTPTLVDTSNVIYTVTDGAGTTATLGFVIDITANTPPTITGSTALDYLENGDTPVATYSAMDAENDDITWSLSDADMPSFTIDNSGVLTFNSSPDFENPADIDANNIYEVTLIATDDNAITPALSTLEVSVTVTNLDEDGIVTITGIVQVGMALTAVLTDPDGSVSNTAYQWLRDGSNIDGATATIYVLTNEDVDSTVQVIVNYDDIHGGGKSVTSDSTLAVTLPDAPNAPTIALFEDSGALDNDGITNNGQITVSNLEDSATWHYSIDSGESFTQGGAISSGASSFVLVEGVYPTNTIQVRQTVNSLDSATTTIDTQLVIDSTAPIIITSNQSQPLFPLNITEDNELASEEITKDEITYRVDGATSTFSALPDSSSVQFSDIFGVNIVCLFGVADNFFGCETTDNNPNDDITGLAPGDEYKVSAGAIKDAAGNENIEVILVPFPLSAPGSLDTPVARPGGDGQAILSWETPNNDGGRPIIRYEYNVRVAGQASNDDWVDVGLTLTTVIPGLQNGVEHLIRVRAVNELGEGTPSNSGRVTPTIPPIANTGSDQSITSGTEVTLDGSASSDSEDDAAGTALSYNWAQTSGTTVTLSSEDTAIATFTAPNVGAETALVFTLTVTDSNGASSSAEVTINVQPISNTEPTANAGDNQSTTSGAEVTLDGSASSDSEDDAAGTALNYNWAQTSGTTVTLSSEDTATATFTAPDVDAETNLVFTLTVTDTAGAGSSDEVTISVLPILVFSDTIDDYTYTVGEAASLTLPIATGGRSPLTYTLDGLPNGFSFDADSRILSGTPTLVDTSNVIYTVTDSADATATLGFVIDVITADNTPPTIALFEDSGALDNDGITNNGQITVSNLEDGATWHYSIDSGESFTQGGAISSGASSFVLVEGVYPTNTIQVRQTVNSLDSATTTIDTQLVIDNTAPIIGTFNYSQPLFPLLITEDNELASEGITKDEITYRLAGAATSTFSALPDSSLVQFSDNFDSDLVCLFGVANNVYGCELTDNNLNDDITGIARGDEYKVSAGAIKDAAGNENIEVILVPVPPEAPGRPNTLVARSGDGQAILSWETPNSDGGRPIIRYEYSFRLDGGSYGNWVDVGLTLTTVITGLQNGSKHITRVRAVNELGGGSPSNSSEVTPTIPPIANTGSDQSITSGTEVTLDGSASSDSEDDAAGTALNYNWAQTSGTTVTLSSEDTAIATFTAPNVGAETALVFTLTVTDSNGASSSAEVTINVQPISNTEPIARAGDDQSITSGAEVTLDGSASSDSEDDAAGTALNYNWAQTSGTTVTLSSEDTATATFTAPDVDAETNLVFTLTVTDTAGAGSSDEVTISVLPVLIFSGTIDDYTYTVGEAASLTLPIATGGRSPLTYTLDGLPNGFSFDADSRILSGTPTLVDTSNVIYTVTDSADATATLGFVIDVITADNTPPTIALFEDSGALDNDGITNNGQITVSNLEDSATWHYSIDSGESFTQGGAISSGASSFVLVEGVYPTNTIQVRQTVNSLDSATTTIDTQLVIDNTAPIIGTFNQSQPLFPLNITEDNELASEEITKDEITYRVDGATSTFSALPDSSSVQFSDIFGVNIVCLFGVADNFFGCETTDNNPNDDITGLAPGDEYKVSAGAIKDAAGNENIEVILVPLPLSAPGSLDTPVARPGGDGQAILSWETPNNDGGRPIIRYEYNVRVAGQASNDDWVDVGLTLTTVIPGLQNGVEHLIRVRAVNELGEGTPSNSGRVTPTIPPIANTGSDQSITSGTEVTLDGSASSDSEDDAAGTALNYNWAQTSGTTVTLSSEDTAIATFTAPNVGAETALVFTLTVTDSNGASSSAEVTINVQPISNTEPIARAGDDQSITSGAEVTLDGSASSDSEDDAAGTALNYNWAQTSGTTVTLSSEDTATATFTAPDVDAETNLVFTLTVTDTAGAGSSDEVTISVLPVLIFSGTIDDYTYTVGEAASLTLPIATGGRSPLTYTLDGLPNGFSFDADSRILSGTPTLVDTSNVIYTVTDSADATATLGFVIDVITADNTPPTIALFEDSGALDNDGITNNGQITVSNLEDSATWHYSIDSGESFTQGGAISSGASSFVLVEGVYPTNTIQVRQTVNSLDSATTTIDTQLVIDNTAPIIGTFNQSQPLFPLNITEDNELASEEITKDEITYRVDGATSTFSALPDSSSVQFSDIFGVNIVCLFGVADNFFGCETTDNNPNDDITGLAPGDEYKVSAGAIKDAAGNENIEVILVPLPLSAPGSLDTPVARPGGDGQAILSWETPNNDGGRPIIRYEYNVRVAGQASNDDWVDVGLTLTTVIPGLQNGVEHLIRVRAVNELGEGTPSNSGRVTPTIPPIANTGSDQSITSGTEVTLDGSASSDSEDDAAGTALNYNWAQTSGTTVTLSSEDTAIATFTAPNVGAETTLVFTLTVTDSNGASSNAEVTINVQPISNTEPIARAGDDQSITSGAEVTLDGSASSDSEDDAAGTALNYNWAQTSGATVTLSSTNTITATFTAPDVDAETNLVFTLTVTDTAGAGSSDEVTISVLPVLIFSGTIDDYTYTVGEAASLTLPIATGGRSPLTYTLDGLPNGFSFDADSRILSGTPTLVDTSNVIYTVTDSADATATLGFVIDVITADNTPPTIALFEDSGALDNDGITNNGQITVSNLEDSATWHYSIDSGESFTQGGAISSGASSFVLVEGVYSANQVQVRQIVSGVTSTIASFLSEITLDTTLPIIAIANPTLNIARDTSYIPTATINERGTLEISGDTLNTGVLGTYNITFTATDIAANSATATQVIIVGPTTPSAPRDLSATPGNGEVSLSWNVPDDDGGSSIIGYQIASKTGNSDFTTFKDILGSSAETQTYTAIGLTNGVTYTFKILAINSVGDGAESNEASAVPMAPLNTEPTANAGDNQSTTSGAEVTLDGSASSDSEDDIAGTALSYNWAQTSGATVTLSSTNTITATFTAPDVGAETTLVFTLTVTDSDGASSSAEVTITLAVTLPDAPNAPTIALFEDSGALDNDGITNNGQITVSNLEDGATWQYSIDSGESFTQGGAISSGGSSFVLVEGVYPTNTIQVRQTVNSLDSATTTIDTQLVIDSTAPIIVTFNYNLPLFPLTIAEDNELASEEITKDEITYRVDGATSTFSALPDSSSVQFSDIFNADLLCLFGLGIGTFGCEITDNNPNDDITGLAPGDEYKVSAGAIKDAAGNENIEVILVPFPLSAPGRPNTPVARPGGDGQAILSWETPDDNGRPIIRYEYNVRVAGQALNDDWVDVGLTLTTVIPGLQNGVEYLIRVRAVNELGESTPSNSGRVTPTIPPIANTGSDQSITSGTEVTLDGSASSDSEDDAAGIALSYNWAQTSGTTVTLSSEDTAIATFTAPNVGAETALVFTLTVTDSNGASSSAEVTINVLPISNTEPIARAGDDQSITSSAEVTLDGSASSDSEDDAAGTALNYNWAQTSGTTVTLSSEDTATATFTAPDVDAETNLVFTLTVTDTAGAGSSDEVTISVLPILVFSGTIDDYTYTVGEAASLTLPIATGGRSPLTYTLDGLPNGFSFDADSRILSGTPTLVDTSNVIYTVNR